MPESVSVASLMIFTSLLPLFAYSQRYIAQNTPRGTAISSVMPTISTVVMIEGSIDTFSVV